MEKICFFGAKLAATTNNIAYTKDVLMTYNVSSYPPRTDTNYIPANKDIVYETLLKIDAECHPKYLYAYIAQCKNEMLAATLTRRGLRTHTIMKALLGLRYNPLKWELYLYVLLNIIRIPNSTLDKILRARYLKRS